MCMTPRPPRKKGVTRIQFGRTCFTVAFPFSAGAGWVTRTTGVLGAKKV
jgi:hypothetical protein